MKTFLRKEQKGKKRQENLRRSMMLIYVIPMTLLMRSTCSGQETSPALGTNYTTIKVIPKMVKQWSTWLKRTRSRSSLRKEMILIGGVILLMTSTTRVWDYQEVTLKWYWELEKVKWRIKISTSIKIIMKCSRKRLIPILIKVMNQKEDSSLQNGKDSRFRKSSKPSNKENEDIRGEEARKGRET